MSLRHVDLDDKYDLTKSPVFVTGYQAIIRLGWPAVPGILHELDVRPHYWFPALEAISGEQPVPPESDVPAARAAWLAWGREHGYLR